MEVVMELAEPLVERSKVVNRMDNRVSDAVSEARTSVGSSVIFNIQKLTDFIEVITGLRVEPWVTSEPLQTAYYAVGGHYSCHLDAVKSKT